MSNEYKHKEAFCLMKYRCRECDAEETVYNTRDGVTPFTIACRNCESGFMTHVDWQNDECNPEYSPLPGQLVFVSCSKEDAEEMAQLVFDNIPEEERSGVGLQAIIDDFYAEGNGPLLKEWRNGMPMSISGE